MSSARLLEAFNAGGKLQATACRMRYDHDAGPNMQVLEFDGRGDPFPVVSRPFAGDPMAKAQDMARRLASAEAQAANPPENPQ